MMKLEQVQDAFLNARFKVEDNAARAVSQFYSNATRDAGIEMWQNLPTAVQREVAKRNPEVAKTFIELAKGGNDGKETE